MMAAPATSMIRSIVSQRGCALQVSACPVTLHHLYSLAGHLDTWVICFTNSGKMAICLSVGLPAGLGHFVP